MAQERRTDVAELEVLRQREMAEKTLMVRKTEGSRRRGLTEHERVGWHHQPNGHEFEQAVGDGEGQGSLACCSPWGHRVGHN